MDSPDEQFMKKLKVIFQTEAHEQLQKITNNLLKIEKSPFEEVKQELIDSTFREAHNLKGSARAVNHTVIQNICQSLESSLSALKEGKLIPSTEFYNAVYAAVDLIEKYIAFEGTQPLPQDEDKIQAIIKKMDSFIEGKTQKASETPVLKKEPPQQAIAEKGIASTTSEPMNQSSIRVSTQKLDSLLQQIEETLMIKLTSKQRVNELKFLLNKFMELKKSDQDLQKKVFQLNTLINSSEDKNKISVDATLLDDLLSFVTTQIDRHQTNMELIYKLSSRADHDYRAGEGIINALFEDTKKVLMHPFGSILESFPRMVRDIASSLEKNVDLNIEGKDIEIDKRILEEIKDPLMHLIRNAVDHGIESPEQRAALGKAPCGKITISAKQVSGNNVEISVTDDGAGINIDKLKAKTVEKFQTFKNELEQTNDDNLPIQLFQPGISTKDTLSEISGRGIGMGVVREQVEKLRGSLAIQSKKNVGTTFIIKLPLTLSTFRGLHIKVDEHEFIIPTHNMRKVLTLPAKHKNTIEGNETLLFQGKHIPYYELSTLLGIPKKKEKTSKEISCIVVIEASGIKIALEVDEIFNEQEIFVKPLGGQLKRVQYISAATIMEWGKVIPILDPFDLVKSATRNPLKS